MTLRQLLHDKRKTIARRWLEAVLATYPGNSAALFARERDPFANPVGHSLRVGTERILDALLDGADVDELRKHLHEIIRIRAIQEFAPSQALGFVLHLKHLVRAELAEELADPKFSVELAGLDAQIDRAALLAFDSYVECREKVYQLRLDEVKRQVAWIVDKLNQHDPDPGLVQIGPKPER
ncbi:MAG: RsbRD N-terminal domain-containing protein [Gemmatimonadales bacterium]